MGLSTDIAKNAIFTAELGPGLIGLVSSVYVGDIPMTSNDMKMFKDDRTSTRYNCFDAVLVQDHNYFLPGCGNGYSFGSESSEACDDGGKLIG